MSLGYRCGVCLSGALNAPLVCLAQLRTDIGEIFVRFVRVLIKPREDTAAIESWRHRNPLPREEGIRTHRRGAIETCIEPAAGFGTVDAARSDVRYDGSFVFDAGPDCIVDVLDRAQPRVDCLPHREGHRDVAGSPQAGGPRFAHCVEEEIGLERAVGYFHEVDIERLEPGERSIDIRRRPGFERALPDRLDPLDLRSRAEQRRAEQRTTRNLAAPREYLLGQIA